MTIAEIAVATVLLCGSGVMVQTMPSPSRAACTSSASFASSSRCRMRSGDDIGAVYVRRMLPGGGWLMTAQKTPSSLIAFTNSWKSTGFTT